MLAKYTKSIAFAIFTIAVASGCTSKGNASAQATAVATVPSVPVVGVGTLAVVKPSGNDIACIRDHGDFEDAMRAHADGNHDAYQSRIEGSKSIALQAGLHVRILDSNRAKDGAQLRLEEGDSAGAVCWVGRDQLDRFAR